MTAKLLFPAVILTLATSSAYAAGPAATAADLAWMTGTWSAPAGPNTLEEHWISPGNQSMGAIVRMSGEAGVSMWEVITIEEVEGSLVMNIQQWNKGFDPRSEVQKLELAEIGAQSVTFKALTEGSMSSLGYSRDGDTFTIHLGQPNGNVVKLDLKAKD